MTEHPPLTVREDPAGASDFSVAAGAMKVAAAGEVTPTDVLGDGRTR
ncbi:hypothetical protein ABZV77_37800 [Streptomyces sp. NPDC004732]